MVLHQKKHNCQPVGLSSHENPGLNVFLVLAGALVFYGTAAFLAIIFSLLEIFFTPPVSLVIIVISGVAALLYYRWVGGDCRKFLLTICHPEIKWLAVFGLAFYMLLWLLAYILPDAENDGLWYHNPTLHFWALKGHVHWITVDVEPFWNDLIDYSWNGYMKGVEVFGFLFLSAVGISRLLNGVNLLLIPLGCLGIVALSRLFGAGRFMAALAGLLFLFVPNVICHAVNLYIDAGVASFYIALFAVMAYTIRDLEGGQYPGKLLPALGCALGLAISAKGTAAVLFLVVPVLLGVYWIRAVRRYPSKKLNVKWGVIFIVLVMAIAILIGGYWYIRNYVHTGSPLYPIGLRLGGRTIFPGVEIPFQFPPPDTPVNKHWPQFFRIIYSWLDSPDDWQTALTEVSHNSGGIGLLWIFGCIPAILWILWLIIRRRLIGGKDGIGFPPSTVSAWIGILILGGIIFFAMPPRHNHKARYVIWLYGIGLPAFAFVSGKAWYALSSFRRRLGRAWIILVIAIFLAEGIYSVSSHIRRISLYRQGVWEGSFRAEHIMRAAVEPYPPGYYLPKLKESIFRRIFPYQEPVAIGELNSFSEQREIVGHLTQGESFGRRRIYFLDAPTAGDPEKLASFIRERKVKYVVWNCDLPVPPALGSAASVWDLVPGWFYVLVVDPDKVQPDVTGGEQIP